MNEFKIRLKENKKKNDVLMTYYESYLRKRRLNSLVIRKYCFNVAFYIYIYLTKDEQIVPAIEGYKVLKDFPEVFMTRYTWTSLRNYESGIYSIDLFYKCLYKKELITKEQYKIVSDFRKKDVPKFMAKYSFEFKKEIVVAYLSGKGGFGSLAKDYGIPNKAQIYRWVKAYQKLGDDGLRRARSINNYSFKYKISVVELYLSSDLSYQELALKEGINSPALIGKWVNAFQIAGPDALRPRMKGRKKTLDNIKKGVTDTSVEHVKELEDELLKLKIENAFLKELRRLRLEDEAKMRERRKSSTVSEDSSN